MNVPTSARSTGVPVRHGHLDHLDEVLEQWFAEHADGVAAAVDRYVAMTRATQELVVLDDSPGACMHAHAY